MENMQELVAPTAGVRQVARTQRPVRIGAGSRRGDEPRMNCSWRPGGAIAFRSGSLRAADGFSDPFLRK